MSSILIKRWPLLLGVLLVLLPLLELLGTSFSGIGDPLRTIFIFAILGISLHILSGFTGLLSLGIAGFMALGSYAYSISTSAVYPFQVSFIFGILIAAIVGGLAGALLGIPTLRLRGDYLAIVTLGFGEIIQDVLRNLEVITKGTQGINPVPGPSFFGVVLTQAHSIGWYYLLLVSLGIAVLIAYNIEQSRLGRALMAIRDDELAAGSIGFDPFKLKMYSFVISSSIAAVSGALWACFLGSSGEPGNYDFNISALALCIVIVGGLGSLRGVLLGSIVMVGFNSIILTRVSELLTRAGLSSTSSVFTSPNNYKYFIFGFALVLMMRLKPEGIAGGRRYESS